MSENSYPDIETAADYAEYERDVASFLEGMEGEPSSGYWKCPECSSNGWDNCDGCSDCETKPEEYAGSFFAWSRCDCCDRSLGGDRESVIGWTKGAADAGYGDDHRWSGSVCIDCVYYFAYGHLDDMTMMKIGEND